MSNFGKFLENTTSGNTVRCRDDLKSANVYSSNPIFWENWTPFSCVLYMVYWYNYMDFNRIKIIHFAKLRAFLVRRSCNIPLYPWLHHWSRKFIDIEYMKKARTLMAMFWGRSHWRKQFTVQSNKSVWRWWWIILVVHYVVVPITSSLV